VKRVGRFNFQEQLFQYFQPSSSILFAAYHFIARQRMNRSPQMFSPDISLNLSSCFRSRKLHGRLNLTAWFLSCMCIPFTNLWDKIKLFRCNLNVSGALLVTFYCTTRLGKTDCLFFYCVQAENFRADFGRRRRDLEGHFIGGSGRSRFCLH
jgi:hypothetical protein